MTDMVDFPEHNEESVDAWDANAVFWDNVQGDTGNDWQRELVFPVILDLLDPLPTRVLEIACGNGNLARQLVRLGARVTATDASSALLDRARERSQGLPINWARLDATDREQIATFAGAADAPFEAAVCSMALMDIAEITPLFDVLPLMLADNAPFVFAILHPAFNPGPDARLFVERLETPDGRLVEERGVRISGYLTTGVQHGIAVVGQPQLQPYFHRTLEALLGAAFERGWMLDGLREPSLAEALRDVPRPNRLTWEHVPDIPPVLLGRLRHRG